MKTTDKTANRIVLAIGFCFCLYFLGIQSTVLVIAIGAVAGLMMGLVITHFNK